MLIGVADGCQAEVVSDSTRDFLVAMATVGIVVFGASSATEILHRFARTVQKKRYFMISTLISCVLVTSSIVPLAISDSGSYIVFSSSVTFLLILTVWILFIVDAWRGITKILFPYITYPLLFSAVPVLVALLAMALGTNFGICVPDVGNKVKSAGINNQVVYNLSVTWIAGVSVLRTFLFATFLAYSANDLALTND